MDSDIDRCGIGCAVYIEQIIFMGLEESGQAKEEYILFAENSAAVRGISVC